MNITFPKISKTVLEIILVFTLVILFAVFATQNFDWFFVPNIDIFQYLCEARMFYTGVLPDYIHPQPLYSLLLYPSSWLFQHVGFPEFFAGKTINLLANCMTLIALYIFSKKYLPLMMRFIFMVLLISHPLLLYTSVNTTPEPLLLVFVCLSLISYRKSPQQSITFAVMAAFVKYEGFIILSALLAIGVVKMIKLFSKKQITTKLVNKLFRTYSIPIVALFILFIWTISSISYNNKQIGSPIFFVTEVTEGVEYIPDLRKITRLIDMLQANVAIYNTNFTNLDMFEFALLVSILLFTVVISKTTKDIELFLSVFFVTGYLLVHTFFPAYNPRYFFPIVPFLFLFCLILVNSIREKIDRPYSKIVFVIMLLLTFGVVTDLSKYKYFDFMKMDQYLQAGKRLAGEWLNQYYSEQDIVVISNGEKQIMSYIESSSIKHPFSTDISQPLCNFEKTHINQRGSTIRYYDIGERKTLGCETILCIIRKVGFRNNKVMVIETDSFSLSLEDTNAVDESCFTQLYESQLGNSYVKIYEFNSGCLVSI